MINDGERDGCINDATKRGSDGRSVERMEEAERKEATTPTVNVQDAVRWLSQLCGIRRTSDLHLPFTEAD